MLATLELLDRIDRMTAEMQALTKAAVDLAKATVKETEARLADDDDWQRMPPRGGRSEGGWSLSKLRQQIKAGVVRKKMVTGFPYYSAADVRKLIAS